MVMQGMQRTMKNGLSLILAVYITLFCFGTVALADEQPQATEATTFVLSNEEDGLIDKWIDMGYGSGSLYEALLALWPGSGGVISGDFLDALANCPGDSQIFTQTLNSYAGITNAVAINTDGSVFTTNIKGRDHYRDTGYSTHPASTTARESFTYANDSSYYIDAPNGGTTYKVFAIGWSMNQPTTLVLSNEEGGEIDWYQYSGYAGFSLYQFLVKIQAHSNGVITDEFLATLAACPANSAIFKTRLYDYRGQTQSICINSDGTVKLLNILGRDYYGQTGYTTCWDNYTASGAFTYTNDPAYFIDAGTNSNGESYKAFAVYWSPILEYRDVATFVLTNEAGGLLDRLIADGYGDYNVYQTMERLKPSSGGVITDEFMASLAACPADSDIFTVPLSILVEYGNYPLCINEDGTLGIAPIYGRDLYQKTGYANYPDSSTATMMFTYPTSADYLVNAGNGYSKGIVYPHKAFGVAWAPAREGKTFVLSNEEGGLIDQLIADGYGNSNLYETLLCLQDESGRVITDEFMETLATCPADSEIFTAKLSDFGGLNNPVCISSDGTLFIAGIFGRDYYNRTGYETYPENIGSGGNELFTYATGADYYIDAGSSMVDGVTTYYKAFAIAWSAEATTFVLSNEYGDDLEGGLIDQLIAAGYGDSSLYDVLEVLQPQSGGVITDKFMAKLAACPADSEIFTAKLSYFGGLNGPVCVNTDGTLGIQPIFGRDYIDAANFATSTENIAGVGSSYFTYPTSPLYYIDAGGRSSGGTETDERYRAFAVLWSPSLFTITGKPTDNTSIMQIDNQNLSLDNTWMINVTNATLRGAKGTDLTADISLTGLPLGLSYTAVNNGGNSILITLSGVAKTALTSDADVSAVVKGNAVTETGAQDSAPISLDLWYIGPGTTFVLSNENGDDLEGGLIDKLEAAGYGDKCMYDVLVALQPYSGGTITDRFLQTLISCPAESEVLDPDANLSNFIGRNNPVAVNADGTLIIVSIYGKDYLGDTGYVTTRNVQEDVGPKFYTSAATDAYLIDTGEPVIPLTKNYRVFAIVWCPETIESIFLTNENGEDDTGGLLDRLVAAGHGDKSPYEIMQILKPQSNGAISDEFMAKLTACPEDSDIFTAKLTDIVNPANNPIGICSDGTLVVAPLYGRDYNGTAGYTTSAGQLAGAGSILFTKADSMQYYIDVGTASGPNSLYEATAIVWAPFTTEATTFVLTNEEGGLIDQLITAGYGTSNLYQVAVTLAPASGGVLTEEFLATLAECPANSEIFTAKLNAYTGINNPVCINSDGTVKINDIFGRDYCNKTGYATFPESSGLSAKQLFTYATDASYYIDAGSSSSSAGITNYKAFAIAWSAKEVNVSTVVLSNEENGLIDKLIDAGHGDSSLYEVLQVLKPLSNGAITDEFMDALAATSLDSEVRTTALSNFASEFNNPIGIGADGNLIVAQIPGRDYYGDQGYTTTSGYHNEAGHMLFTAADNDEYYIDAGTLVIDGSMVYYKAFAIAWAPNIVNVPTVFLSNEENGLIDDLIAAGYVDSSLYEVLQVLKPLSNGSISDEFMNALAACPEDCDAKTAKLSDFSDPSNNPIGIGSNGYLIVAPVNGRDLYGTTGFTTNQEEHAIASNIMFTSAQSEEHYIDAGAQTPAGVTYYFKAVTVVWAPETVEQLPDAPVISPESGSYNDKVTVIINGSGGTICYTTDGSDPTADTNPARMTYTASFDLTQSATVKAAVYGGELWSDIAARDYIVTVTPIKPEAPVISPKSGSYNYKFTVSISGTGGTICYTTDGTDPTTSSTTAEYTAPFDLIQSGTVKAAINNGNMWSEVASEDYVIDTHEQIPEFPTVALPMVVVIGLGFVFMRRRE